MLLAETLTQPSETPDLVIGIFETTRKGSGWSAALHNLPRLPQPHALTLSLATSAGVRGVWERSIAYPSIQANKGHSALHQTDERDGEPFDLPGPLRLIASGYATTACGQRDCSALLTQTGFHFCSTATPLLVYTRRRLVPTPPRMLCVIPCGACERAQAWVELPLTTLTRT